MSPELLRLALCAEEILYYYVPAYVYAVAEQLLKKPQHHDLVLAIVTPRECVVPSTRTQGLRAPTDCALRYSKYRLRTAS